MSEYIEVYGVWRVGAFYEVTSNDNLRPECIVSDFKIILPNYAVKTTIKLGDYYYCKAIILHQGAECHFGKHNYLTTQHHQIQFEYLNPANDHKLLIDAICTQHSKCWWWLKPVGALTALALTDSALAKLAFGGSQ